jgi:glutamate-1-semialdehyde aminotransferase
MNVARRHGAVFLMDEVKTGFRAPGGSMQAYYGMSPDMTTVSKALGNGWAVAAVLGTRAVMDAAAGMHVSATYHGDTTAMAAALATLEIMDREKAADHVDLLGIRLIDGLNAAAVRHRCPAVAYGEPVPAMPFLRFGHADGARNDALKHRIYAHAFSAGVLLHPRHLWFICTAHSEADIDRAVAVMEEAMALTAREAPELLDRDS